MSIAETPHVLGLAALMRKSVVLVHGYLPH